jgi:hypothetical protein
VNLNTINFTKTQPILFKARKQFVSYEDAILQCATTKLVEKALELKIPMTDPKGEEYQTFLKENRQVCIEQAKGYIAMLYEAKIPYEGQTIFFPERN